MTCQSRPLSARKHHCDLLKLEYCELPSPCGRTEIEIKANMSHGSKLELFIQQQNASANYMRNKVEEVNDGHCKIFIESWKPLCAQLLKSAFRKLLDCQMKHCTTFMVRARKGVEPRVYSIDHRQRMAPMQICSRRYDIAT